MVMPRWRAGAGYGLPSGRAAGVLGRGQGRAATTRCALARDRSWRGRDAVPRPCARPARPHPCTTVGAAGLERGRVGRQQLARKRMDICAHTRSPIHKISTS